MVIKMTGVEYRGGGWLNARVGWGPAESAETGTNTPKNISTASMDRRSFGVEAGYVFK